MNIHEYQAKQLFRQYAIAVPEGNFAADVQQAKQVADELGGKAWVVKAQVHAGGRGKVGGVKLADSLEQVTEYTEEMLGKRLVTIQTGKEGLPVDKVLVEKVYPIKREFYISLLVDRETERLLFIVSAAGGMDIETVADETPEEIHTISINPAAGLQSYQCRKAAFALTLSGKQILALEQIMRGMLQLFQENDASQVEINPLIETDTGALMALDAKINFDENALAMHAEIASMRDPGQEDEKENIARQFDLNYVSLDGSIGCMVNGAGLAMATMDLVKLKGGKPANFLDVGGGTTTDKVTEAFRLILSDKQVKVVVVNIFGGIVQCDIIAQGIIQAVQGDAIPVPVIVRLEGTNAEAGRKLLNDAGLDIHAAEDMESAAELAVKLAEEMA